MLMRVNGLPVALCIGMAFTSILDVETGGSSLVACLGSSFLTGAVLMAVSLEADR